MTYWLWVIATGLIFGVCTSLTLGSFIMAIKKDKPYLFVLTYFGIRGFFIWANYLALMKVQL